MYNFSFFIFRWSFRKTLFLKDNVLFLYYSLKLLLINVGDWAVLISIKSSFVSQVRSDDFRLGFDWDNGISLLLEIVEIERFWCMSEYKDLRILGIYRKIVDVSVGCDLAVGSKNGFCWDWAGMHATIRVTSENFSHFNNRIKFIIQTTIL